MTWEIRQGDALEQLRLLPSGSVQTCITSPPYFGLRDYGTGEWEGGDEGCDHADTAFNAIPQNRDGRETPGGRGGSFPTTERQFKDVCGKCGARRTDQQVGLEQTPDAYVARLVEVFREVRRVLRDDGTLWLNLGDSYATQRNDHVGGGFGDESIDSHSTIAKRGRFVPRGCKMKDLLGIPWMVAFALRADGWYLRSDIVWSKPNPMPESVTDRPTKAHEYLFLLAKSPRYFFDQDAIREAHTMDPDGRNTGRVDQAALERPKHGDDPMFRTRPGSRPPDYFGHPAGRNKRSVWTVATQPFPGAHFAVFPPKLIEPCVLAGSSPRACGVCGGPWERVTEKMPVPAHVGETSGRYSSDESIRSASSRGIGKSRQYYREHGLEGPPPPRTVGWKPSCDCFTSPEEPYTRSCLVLDPFSGAGTTGLVALQHGRSFIGIELNPAYVEMARERIATAERLGFRPPERGPDQIVGQLSLEGDAA